MKAYLALALGRGFFVQAKLSRAPITWAYDPGPASKKRFAPPPSHGPWLPRGLPVCAWVLVCATATGRLHRGLEGWLAQYGASIRWAGEPGLWVVGCGLGGRGRWAPLHISCGSVSVERWELCLVPLSSSDCFQQQLWLITAASAPILAIFWINLDYCYSAPILEL